MSFRLRIKYFLIHRLNYTNKTAGALISSGKLTVNGKAVITNEILTDQDELKNGDEVLKPAAAYKYYALNKPVGIESTFSRKIKNNLTEIFPLPGAYVVAGRLDKASEGLLLISTNGKWANSIMRPDNGKEKEYEVEVDKPIDDHFIEMMGGGVNIGFYVTQACVVIKTGEKKFRIILREGKNKQIRRMCKKLGFGVLSLKRIRIDKFYLSDLKDLSYEELSAV